MTGYAVIERDIGQHKYRLHLKSVNHRFLELRWKSPRAWLPFEALAKNIFQKALGRGSLDFWVEDISPSRREQNKTVVEFFSRLAAAVDEGGPWSWKVLPSPVRALILARFPDLWLKSEEGEESEEISLQQPLEEIAEALQASRSKEGAGISAALQKCAEDIRSWSQALTKDLPKARDIWEKDYKARIEKLAEDFKVEAPSHDRLLQEWLILAEKREVSEELQRIESHLKLLDETLVSPPENCGKKLEFLTQELHREWTTLGNKLHDAQMAQKIIEAKVAVEKIREQTLNIA